MILSILLEAEFAPALSHWISYVLCEFLPRQPARHGKAVYWDLGSAQSLGSVTADLKPGVARVEVWAGQFGTTVRTKLSVFQECFRLHMFKIVQRQFWNAFDDRYQVISVHLPHGRRVVCFSGALCSPETSSFSRRVNLL